MGIFVYIRLDDQKNMGLKDRRLWSGSGIQSEMILPDVCDNQLLDFLARFSSVTIHNVGNSVFRSLELLSHLQSETSSTLGGKRSWEHFRWEHFWWEHF